MAHTKLLTNIIQRKVMLVEEMSQSNQRYNFEISLTDFAEHPIIDRLYKADNQRSTECWSVEEIHGFIDDCLMDRNVNLSILYWKDTNENLYVIDGGHRLSIIYAWVKRYFADEQVEDAPIFTNAQKKDIRLIRNNLGDLADFQKVCEDPVLKDKLKDTKLSFRQVVGTPEQARKVFRSINSDTKRLDKYEEFHLQNRGSDAFYATYACCYINDNRSNLAELQYERINQIIELGEEIHDHLFHTILLDADLTHGRKIGLVSELLNIIAGDASQNIYSNDQGRRVEELMHELWAVLCRISTPTKSIGIPSLGLHPRLYFYKDQNFQITSFLAWFAIVFEIDKGLMEIEGKKVNYKNFIRVRRSVEFLLSNFPVATAETVGKYGSGIKGYERLQTVYKAFICISLTMELDFDDEKRLNTFILSMCKSFKYINFNEFYLERFVGSYDEEVIHKVVGYVESLSPGKKNKPKAFSSLTKKLLRDEFEARNHNHCEICDGLIYVNSTEADHRIALSKGGHGIIENGVLVHPICNRIKSDRSLAEVRADLFD
ncbi:MULTISPECIES: HNH endonuclease [Acinetobacter]|uniref:HNH endonuclease n=1 Tax=Acinetobacter TaxID=469 RepID=UPI0015D24028|nr:MULTISPECIES: HNH endonuclease [Acinetobacter]MDM1328931.1 HNH endonuclease [Acinetobacter indicus]MEB5929169.1 HNH endonuclease [Acinetobacter schindleri]